MNINLSINKLVSLIFIFTSIFYTGLAFGQYKDYLTFKNESQHNISILGCVIGDETSGVERLDNHYYYFNVGSYLKREIKTRSGLPQSCTAHIYKVTADNKRDKNHLIAQGEFKWRMPTSGGMSLYLYKPKWGINTIQIHDNNFNVHIKKGSGINVIIKDK